MKESPYRSFLVGVALVLACGSTVPLRAADTFNWNTNRSQVTADVKSGKLLEVLEKIAAATGWRVFVEPETIHTVSAKFSNLAPGEALHLLLGDVNFALLPGTNASARLYVFRTSRERATQSVEPVKAQVAQEGPKAIANELIV